jgi:hypothetical protein
MYENKQTVVHLQPFYKEHTINATAYCGVIGNLRYTHNIRSRDSAACKVTGYGLKTDGLEFESRWVKDFSLLHVVQTGSEAHPASCPMSTGGSIPGVKRQGREADHSPPASAEVKKTWVYTSTPPYVFMA